MTNPDTPDLVAEIKKVHRTFPSGVTIVTTLSGGKPYGLAVNAFSSVSLDPPMVLVCINGNSSTYPHFFAAQHFGVSILAHDQKPVAARFAQSGGDKFDGLDWFAGANGVPLIGGAASHLELGIATMLMAGTHTIMIGRVLSAAASGKASLVYSAGGFFDGAQLVAAD